MGQSGWVSHRRRSPKMRSILPSALVLLVASYCLCQQSYVSPGGGGNGGAADSGLDGGLEVNIPGIPGEDYPIYASVPDTGFACDGLVEGGYYADPAAECQAFHICANGGEGGLRTYSVLCPNGTIFNQGVFVCAWWFNFDCAEADAAGGGGGQASAPGNSYSSGGGQARYQSLR